MKPERNFIDIALKIKVHLRAQGLLNQDIKHLLIIGNLIRLCRYLNKARLGMVWCGILYIVLMIDK